MQIQEADVDELIKEVRHLPDQVPAQVHFIHVTQLLDALRHHSDLLETEIQLLFTIQCDLHALMNHLQGHFLTFLLLAFPSFGHAAAGRYSTMTTIQSGAGLDDYVTNQNPAGCIIRE